MLWQVFVIRALDLDLRFVSFGSFKGTFKELFEFLFNQTITKTEYDFSNFQKLKIPFN